MGRLREFESAQSLGRLDTVHHRHLPVQENDLVRLVGLALPLDGLDGLAPLTHVVDNKGHRSEQIPNHHARGVVVIDHQHAASAQIWPGLKAMRG